MCHHELVFESMHTYISVEIDGTVCPQIDEVTGSEPFICQTHSQAAGVVRPDCIFVGLGDHLRWRHVRQYASGLGEDGRPPERQTTVTDDQSSTDLPAGDAQKP